MKSAITPLTKRAAQKALGADLKRGQHVNGFFFPSADSLRPMPWASSL
jgi:hypothetical protein